MRWFADTRVALGGRHCERVMVWVVTLDQRLATCVSASAVSVGDSCSGVFLVRLLVENYTELSFSSPRSRESVPIDVLRVDVDLQLYIEVLSVLVWPARRLPCWWQASSVSGALDGNIVDINLLRADLVLCCDGRRAPGPTPTPFANVPMETSGYLEARESKVVGTEVYGHVTTAFFLTMEVWSMRCQCRDDVLLQCCFAAEVAGSQLREERGSTTGSRLTHVPVRHPDGVVGISRFGHGPTARRQPEPRAVAPSKAVESSSFSGYCLGVAK